MLCASTDGDIVPVVPVSVSSSTCVLVSGVPPVPACAAHSTPLAVAVGTYPTVGRTGRQLCAEYQVPCAHYGNAREVGGACNAGWRERRGVASVVNVQRVIDYGIVAKAKFFVGYVRVAAKPDEIARTRQG